MTKLPKGIRLRNGRYQVDVQVDGKRKTGTMDSLEDAIKLQAQLRAALLAGEDAIPSTSTRSTSDSWTLGTAFKRTHEEEWKGTRGEKTALINAKSVLKFFGEATRLDQITTDEVKEFKAHLYDSGISPATVNRKMAALSKMIAVAIEHGKLKHRPLMKREKETKGRIRYLTEQEEEAMLNLLRQWAYTDHVDAFIILIETGMRPSELWRLKGTDVNLRTGQIHIWVNKTDNPRTIVGTSAVIETIKRRMQAHGLGLLFPGANNWWFVRAWNRAKDHLGLGDDEEFIPYALRHTCCSRMIMADANLMKVQQWMGHKHITTTRRYAHLAPKAMESLASLLDKRRQSAVSMEMPEAVDASN